MTDVQHRYIQFEGTEVRQDDDGRRHLVGIVVPWHGRYEMKPGTFERFSRTAFDKSVREHGDDISLYEQHETRSTMPIGRAVTWENTNDGLIADFRMHRTARAEEIVNLAEDQAVTGLSVGFIPVRNRTDQEGDHTVITRLEARLDHVGFVTNPAYNDARIVAVRDYNPDDPDIAPRLARWRAQFLT